MLLVECFIGLIIFGALVFFFVTMHSRRQGDGTFDRKYFATQWKAVLQLVGGGESGWRLAIIDADKLLDHALKQRGGKGDDMAARLRETEARFSHYNQLWAAHKLRNRLVHEPNVRLSKQVTQRSLAEFQRALKELGAL